MDLLPSLAPTFDEPIEMLEACHGRIEAQLTTLERLTQRVAAQGTDADARVAARAVMRYFDTAGVHHHRDEEEDVFPLLRTLAAERGRAEIAAVSDELGREHATMDLQWSRLRERLAAMAAGADVRLDADEVARFAWTYRRHMETEAASLLPFAKEALSVEQRALLGERMAARRKALP
jgi:hemerythrin-like domain-containing protein